MAFIEFTLRKGSADSPPIWSQGFGPLAENDFRDFHRAK